MTNDATLAAAGATVAQKPRSQGAPPPPADDPPQGVTRYTHAQLQAIMENVAGKADTLRTLLMYLQQQPNAERDYLAAQIGAAALIAENIGAITDNAAGATLVGDHDRWNFGPGF